jgi:hypothetical protein
MSAAATRTNPPFKWLRGGLYEQPANVACGSRANTLPQPSLVNHLVGTRWVEKIVNRMKCSRPCLRGEDNKIMPVRSPQLSVLDFTNGSAWIVFVRQSVFRTVIVDGTIVRCVLDRRSPLPLRVIRFRAAAYVKNICIAARCVNLKSHSWMLPTVVPWLLVHQKAS